MIPIITKTKASRELNLIHTKAKYLGSREGIRGDQNLLEKKQMFKRKMKNKTKIDGLIEQSFQSNSHKVIQL